MLSTPGLSFLLRQLVWLRTNTEVVWFRTNTELVWLRTKRELVWLRTNRELVWLRTKRELVSLMTNILVWRHTVPRTSCCSVASIVWDSQQLHMQASWWYENPIPAW